MWENISRSRGVHNSPVATDVATKLFGLRCLYSGADLRLEHITVYEESDAGNTIEEEIGTRRLIPRAVKVTVYNPLLCN